MFKVFKVFKVFKDNMRQGAAHFEQCGSLLASSQSLRSCASVEAATCCELGFDSGPRAVLRQRGVGLPPDRHKQTKLFQYQRSFSGL